MALSNQGMQAMGSWYLSIAVSILLILLGLATHWVVMFAGVLLLFIPPLAVLISRRRARRESADSDPQ